MALILVWECIWFRNWENWVNVQCLFCWRPLFWKITFLGYPMLPVNKSERRKVIDFLIHSKYNSKIMSLYNTICWKKTRRKKMKVSTHQELEKSGRLICTEIPKERIVKRPKNHSFNSDEGQVIIVERPWNSVWKSPKTSHLNFNAKNSQNYSY